MTCFPKVHPSHRVTFSPPLNQNPNRLYTSMHSPLLVGFTLTLISPLHLFSPPKDRWHHLGWSLVVIRYCMSISFDNCVLLPVVITLTCEKTLSTLPLLEVREKSSSMRIKKLAQSKAHGALKTLHQVARYCRVESNMYWVAYSSTLWNSLGLLLSEYQLLVEELKTEIRVSQQLLDHHFRQLTSASLV